MRFAFASLLATMVFAGPAYAQAQAPTPPSSLREAVRVAAARQAQAAPAPARSEMSPALKWTGIGLLIGGGVTMLTGALVDDACLENEDFFNYSVGYCNDVQTVWIASGGAMAGTGAALLLIGHAKSSPSIVVGPRRVAWKLRF